uniref:Uncharacterized protein n=1 Tax=Gossypium raimondii TaxID=29730 RepID=A0A0D2RNY0_GOSRA|nr:hypothetical protein B456_005G185900 [Gossypium raimondii]
MGSLSKALLSSTLRSLPSFSSPPTPFFSFSSSYSFTPNSPSFAFKSSFTSSLTSKAPTPNSLSFSSTTFICKAAEYKFPDPIPEFADAEMDKFRSHLLNKLSKKDTYGDSVEEVVGICTERLIVGRINGKQVLCS